MLKQVFYQNHKGQILFYYHTKGLKIEDHDLFLDADRVVPFSFISHGHGDHLRNHKTILATPPTIDFFKIRFEQRIKKPQFIPLDFFKPYDLDGLKITLYPAGHILGSAMILIEKENMRLLYSGDFKLQPSLTAEQIKIPEADILIMESTYGKPVYSFSKERFEIPEKMDSIISDIRKKDYLPVILAYNLGKAQEVLAILSEMGYRILVHPVAWRICDIYKKFGQNFNNCFLFEGSINQKEDILIIPPHFEKHLWTADNFPRFQTIFLSGWAKARQFGDYRKSANYSLPLSDHADYEELIEFVKIVNPKKVFTLHGFSEFPKYLRKAGFDAKYLLRLKE